MTLSLTRNQPHKLPKAATCRVAMCQLDKQVPVDLENSKSKWISSSPTVRLVGAVLFSGISVPWPRGHSNLRSVSPLVPWLASFSPVFYFVYKVSFQTTAATVLQGNESSSSLLALPGEAESIIGGSSRARVGQPSSNPRASSPLAECP